MKKLICMILAAALMTGLLAGCGAQKKEKEVDLTGVYTKMQETLPEMMTLDAENMLNLLGIQADDCVQAIAAVCAVGLQADEVWLLQAKDAQALERLKTLAFSPHGSQAGRDRILSSRPVCDCKEGRYPDGWKLSGVPH